MTIVDLFFEKGIVRTVSHQKLSLRFAMQWEVPFQQNISLIVCLLMIFQIDMIKMPHYLSHIEINIIWYVCCLLIITYINNKSCQPQTTFWNLFDNIMSKLYLCKVFNLFKKKDIIMQLTNYRRKIYLLKQFY